ncbi:MAG: hypothetical protein WCA24_05000, partial [Thiomonas sp.]
MKIKRYTGTNTREVLTRIRNDLGAEAVILSNREIVGGVELMAAVDFDASRFPSDEQGETAVPVEASSSQAVAAPKAAAPAVTNVTQQSAAPPVPARAPAASA